MECVICFENMTGEFLQKCGHRFHADCIKTLTKCPLCRRELKAIENHLVGISEIQLMKRQDPNITSEQEYKLSFSLGNIIGPLVRIEMKKKPEFKPTISYEEYEEKFEEKISRTWHSRKIFSYIRERQLRADSYNRLLEEREKIDYLLGCEK